MKISFKKVQKAPIKFSLDFVGNFSESNSDFQNLDSQKVQDLENSQSEKINLSGTLKRLDSKIVKLEAQLKGQLEVVCARSGEYFFINLNESLVLLISDGLWNVQSQSGLDSLDVIEFFDGEIDLDYILESEVQSIQSDYHIKGE